MTRFLRFRYEPTPLHRQRDSTTQGAGRQSDEDVPMDVFTYEVRRFRRLASNPRCGGRRNDAEHQGDKTFITNGRAPCLTRRLTSLVRRCCIGVQHKSSEESCIDAVQIMRSRSQSRHQDRFDLAQKLLQLFELRLDRVVDVLALALARVVVAAIILVSIGTRRRSVRLDELEEGYTHDTLGSLFCGRLLRRSYNKILRQRCVHSYTACSRRGPEKACSWSTRCQATG